MESIFNCETFDKILEQKQKFAILPIGAYEQHGYHLPVTTDTLIAGTIAKSIADTYNGLLLPPITLSCSHEHQSFLSVSISSETLGRIVKDVFSSLQHSGIKKLILVNGHGGNYVLNNIVQEANIESPSIMLFPMEKHWKAAKSKITIDTPEGSSDMHGGEIETSIMLSYFPQLVKENKMIDVDVKDRSMLHLYGTKEYTHTGVVGFPNLGSASKGTALIEGLIESLNNDLLRFLEDANIDA